MSGLFSSSLLWRDWGKTMNNNERESYNSSSLRIGKRISIQRDERFLNLELDWIGDCVGYIFAFFIPMNGFLIFLFFLTFYLNNIMLWITITIFAIVLTPSYPAFIDSLKRMEKFSFDNTLKKATKEHWKLKEFSFSEIVQINLKVSITDYCLTFILRSSKRVLIWSGTKEDCEKLGNVLAVFLGKPFNIEPNE